MATLAHPTLTGVSVTVPDSAVTDWTDQGWVEDPVTITAPAAKLRPKRIPRATT